MSIIDFSRVLENPAIKITITLGLKIITLKENFNNLINAKIALIKKWGGGIVIDVLSIKIKSYLFLSSDFANKLHAVNCPPYIFKF